MITQSVFSFGFYNKRDKQKLINFVLDIEKYPEFIPFCIDSKVYETKDEVNEIKIIAKDKAGLFYSFNTLAQLLNDSNDQKRIPE